MKFKVLEDPCVKTTIGVLEKDNTHDTAVCGLPENEAEALHEAGLIQIEGKEAGKRDPNKKVTLKPAKMSLELGVNKPA